MPSDPFGPAVKKEWGIDVDYHHVGRDGSSIYDKCANYPSVGSVSVSSSENTTKQHTEGTQESEARTVGVQKTRSKQRAKGTTKAHGTSHEEGTSHSHGVSKSRGITKTRGTSTA